MKATKFRAMMLVLLMAVVSLGTRTVYAQVFTVTGIVTDAGDGTPIIGCSVKVKGTTNGAITNEAGRYSIRARRLRGWKEVNRIVSCFRDKIRFAEE